MTNYTVDDIYALPDGERAELMDGMIYMTTPPNRAHQKLVSELNIRIGTYIKSHHGDCEVYPAPFAVFLNADNHTYVEPDISVICDKDKLDDRGCNGTPDWIIEIVSPSSRRMDYCKKLFKYQEAGVREYWIVDPQKKRVQTYFLEGLEEEKGDYGEFSFDEDIPVGIYDGWSIRIGKLLE
ncbi:MAG: Uma2 family endonuclease [Firmicutes bacterium]|nr:Uma2 family endonuclease [Bacillota bacterium]